jgi:hypothetical protein
VSERKQFKKVCGLAGRRKRCVIKERQDKKAIHSKALLLAETLPPAAEPRPFPQD